MLKLSIILIDEEAPGMNYKLHREVADGMIARLSLGAVEVNEYLRLLSVSITECNYGNNIISGYFFLNS